MLIMNVPSYNTMWHPRSKSTHFFTLFFMSDCSSFLSVNLRPDLMLHTCISLISCITSHSRTIAQRCEIKE